MGPGDAVRSVLTNFSNFSGRASRSEYWWWIGAVLLAEMLVLLVGAIVLELGTNLYLVMVVGAIIPSLAVAARRLHDTGRSGWWLLLGIVPLLGLVLLILFLLDSEPGPNQWGSATKRSNRGIAMDSTTKLWIAAPLTLGLVLAGCSGDDGDDADADVTDAPASTPTAATSDEAEPTAAVGAGAETSAGTLLLGDEEIAMGAALCWFQEQPRAGLGGVFTHTAQAEGTNAAGQAVLLDMSRARAEDGTVEDDIIVDIGDYTSEDAISLHGGGPEGVIEFGDASASADGVEVTDFETDPVSLSFDLACR